MKSRWGSVLIMLVVLGVVGSAAAFWVLRSGADEKSAAPKPTPPATTKVVKETELNVLTLTPDAERRLDVKTAPVERKKVRRARFFGGQITVPPGRAVVVSAPFAGTVQPPADAPAPAVGRPVKKGQVLFALLPLLTNEARTTLTTALVDAEGLVSAAAVQLRAAEVALERAKQLVAEEAGTKRSLDDAQAQYDLAKETLDSAKARLDALTKATKGAEAGSVEPLTVESPESGVLRNVQVAPGQMVAAGAPLFEVINTEHLWVRVPVYAGDIGTVAADQPAVVGALGGSAAPGVGAKAVTAEPVSAPPSADPLGSTVDLFYVLDNQPGTFSPGQKVGVTLPLRDDEETLVVPWAAVVFDVHAGAWVYAKVGDHAYARRRVQVRRVVDGQAVLESGPPPGTQVVTQSVMELFGTEMGFAK
jgi:RND family efflux transporter MFP subunit